MPTATKQFEFGEAKDFLRNFELPKKKNQAKYLSGSK
jgi:hypothetical protein